MTKHKKNKIEKIEEKNVSRIQLQSIEKEVQDSYLDYAMSVIVSRALPDVRDGLKPVQRRILYAMWRMGLKSSAKYRKSAAIVGEVLGKFHPHGDLAVYDALARMAQDFSLRYPLIDGQGNWGSIDGDPPAAQRYTEAKLERIAEEILSDIEKEVVPFSPNYDGTIQEPQVLPAKLPTLLLNGALGIAVGVATSIPPHNLKEVAEAIVYLIDHPKATIDDLMRFIKGPDFPTGGLIFDPKKIREVYATGKGPIVIRAKTEIVETHPNHFQILITEIPFQVNKSALLEHIAQLVKEKKVSDIKGLRDESDKDGIRIVIELRRHAYPQKVLNQLFKLTDLQSTFHVNFVVLVNGLQPSLLNLKSILEEYIKHRQIIIRKRTEFDLARTKERIHILKGLNIALEHIDAIIKLIKKSKDREAAKVNLMKQYKLSEIQANAILEMRLQQLAGLERIKIETELKEKLKLEKELTEILGKPRKILQIIKDEVKELVEKYGDERRTQVIPHLITDFKQEDLIPDEATLILITNDGYIKRLAPTTFKTQTRGGKGVIGFETKAEDTVKHLVATTTHANLLFFTTKGRVFQMKAYNVPESSRIARGQALVNFLQMAGDEKVSALLAVAEKKERLEFLTMVTKKGMIKKTKIDEMTKVRQSGLIAIKLKKDDELSWVKPTSGQDEIILVTSGGQSIRFSEKDLRPMGRATAGVYGIRLTGNNYIAGMDVIKDDKEQIANSKLLVVTEYGFGKLTPIKDYRLQKRGGSGIKTARLTEKVGQIVSAMVINDKNLPEHIKGDLLIVSKSGQVIRIPLKSVPTLGRTTQGVRLMRLKDKEDKVVSVTLI